MSDESGKFKMTAVDQRPPIKGPIAKHLGMDEAPWEEVARFKGLLVETLQDQSSAMLLDPHYAIPYSIGSLSPTKGLIVTLEDSLFEEADQGRLSSDIDDWSVAKIKRMGADAVKVPAGCRSGNPRSATTVRSAYRRAMPHSRHPLPARAIGVSARIRQSSDQ